LFFGNTIQAQWNNLAWSKLKICAAVSRKPDKRCFSLLHDKAALAKPESKNAALDNSNAAFINKILKSKQFC
jgi:hypothetical protein